MYYYLNVHFLKYDKTKKSLLFAKCKRKFSIFFFLLVIVDNYLSNIVFIS